MTTANKKDLKILVIVLTIFGILITLNEIFNK